MYIYSQPIPLPALSKDQIKNKHPLDLGHRVPKHICNVISVGMRTHQTLLRASCIYLGHMVHGGQRVGGGPKIVCMYLLEYSSRHNIAEVANHLRRYVNEDFIFLC